MPKSLRPGVYALFLCGFLVTIAYQFIDKPVAYWVYDHHLAQYSLLKLITKIPEIFYFLLLILYPILVIRFCLGKQEHKDKIWLAFANSIVIADFLHVPLKYMFNRYWPETWLNNNKSLIHDGVYGFSWFHPNGWSSFPSGHTTIIVAAMAILWIAYPRWRWFSAIIAISVMFSLIGMDYHFVGDVIGGTFLGGIIAYYTAKLSGLIK